MVYFFFGYPGIGKDFCAKRLSQLLSCLNIDADTYLTDPERQKLKNGTFTSEDRINKLRRICDDLSSKLENNNDITIGDSLPNQAAREYIANYFGDKVVMILILSESKLHNKRITNRKNHFFTKDILKDYIKNNWEPVTIDCLKLNNDSDNIQELDKGLLEIINLSKHEKG